MQHSSDCTNDVAKPASRLQGRIPPHQPPSLPPPMPSPTTNLLLFTAFIIIALFPNLLIPIVKLPFTLPSTTTSHHAPPRPPTTMSTTYLSKTFSLPPRSRGSYLITDHVTSSLPELRTIKVGLLHLFVQHTSCALSMNENWDEEVREDMSDALDRIVPEDKGGRQGLYRHAAEGSDDMPAHVKSALIGASVTVPIRDGRLATGTWQGIWYLEFRAMRHSRKVVATIQGEKI